MNYSVYALQFLPVQKAPFRYYGFSVAIDAFLAVNYYHKALHYKHLYPQSYKNASIATQNP